MTHGTQLLELLADRAATATTSTARCQLCRRSIRQGERYAWLIATDRPAHLLCIGRAANIRRTVPLIR